MSAGEIIFASGFGILYGLIALYVGYDTAVFNRGVHPVARLSPWFRGACWLPLAVWGLILTWGDAQRQR